MKLAAIARRVPPVVTLAGAACATTELLRSPASGTPCVHWRLRIVEHLTARMQLVHEAASHEAFELLWTQEPGRVPVRVRIDPMSALIQAAPILHREGTPGAQAVARQFGLRGVVRVEEVVIHQGEEMEADGLLEDPNSRTGEGPFRGGDRAPELMEATVRLPTRNIGPTLLPWALGTAAALLGGLGTAAYIAHQIVGRGVLPRLEPRALASGRAVAPEIGRARIPHPRLP